MRSRYTAVKLVEALAVSDLRRSVGSVGDAYANALAATTMRLHTTDAIPSDSCFGAIR
ncbi:hypothetical protein [Nocardia cyriacigeorgica]|uniref:hypothetical protein n=1 Tax=Nocardia cyriacigeorgica TaxID=135487 RepID=UPI002457886A|nr:hypothetical protein [Nocardia cyriacigeorgica]